MRSRSNVFTLRTQQRLDEQRAQQLSADIGQLIAACSRCGYLGYCVEVETAGRRLMRICTECQPRQVQRKPAARETRKLAAAERRLSR